MTKDKAKAADPAAGQGKKITVKATNARGKEIAKSVNVNTEALISNIEQARKWVDLWEDAKRLKPYIEAILRDNPEEYSRLTFDDVLNLPASDDAIQLFQGLLTSAKKYEKLQQELADLKPFILEMLEEDPEKCEGLTLDDIYTLPATSDGIKLLRKIVKRVRGKKGHRTIANARDEVTNIQYNNTEGFCTVTDNLPKKFFSPATPPRAERLIPVPYTRKDSKEIISAWYYPSYNENMIKEHSLPARLSDKEYFICMVLDNLLDEGNSTCTLTKIWHELGGHGTPAGNNHLEPLYKSLLLGLSTMLVMDYKQLFQEWNTGPEKYKHDTFTSPVMPIQMDAERSAFNGTLSKVTIHITAHTPFYVIAQTINNRLTKWPKETLKLYKGKRTDRYYRILRYLMDQIAWMRNSKGKRSAVLKYETLYKECGETSARDQQLAQEMTRALLEQVFIPIGYIKSYGEKGKPGENDENAKKTRIILSFPKEPQPEIETTKKQA